MSYDQNHFWFWVSFLSVSTLHTSPDDYAGNECENEPMYLPDILPMCCYAAFHIES